jgi:hypothetical protein
MRSSRWSNTTKIIVAASLILSFTILVAILYFILAQIENLYLVPRFVGSRVKLDAMVALISVIIGTIVFGALGVLLAMPVVAIEGVIFDLDGALIQIDWRMAERMAHLFHWTERAIPRPAHTLGMATVGVTSGLSDAYHLADADLILDNVTQLEERL